jgi:hypothetical protein
MVVASAEGKKYLQKSIEKYLEKSIERDAVAVASVHLPALGAHWCAQQGSGELQWREGRGTLQA